MRQVNIENWMAMIRLVLMMVLVIMLGTTIVYLGTLGNEMTQMNSGIKDLNDNMSGILRLVR